VKTILMFDGKQFCLLGCAMAVATFAIDALFRYRPPALAGAAILDLTAHATTVVLFLGAARMRFDRVCFWGGLLGAILIDVDHVPDQFFGWEGLTAGTYRPYPHSLLTVIAIVCLGFWLIGARRRFAFGVAFGLVAHLIRDMATGGVPLWWPLTPRTIAIPYGLYATLVVVALALLLWRRRDRIIPDADP
jgi:hypothetical protein